MVTGFDAERAVIFKSDPLKGCKKTSGTIVGVEGGKGVVSVGGGRAARFRLI
jgi:20S proteasome alpha/beta subunit